MYPERKRGVGEDGVDEGEVGRWGGEGVVAVGVGCCEEALRWTWGGWNEGLTRMERAVVVAASVVAILDGSEGGIWARASSILCALKVSVI